MKGRLGRALEQRALSERDYGQGHQGQPRQVIDGQGTGGRGGAVRTDISVFQGEKLAETGRDVGGRIAALISALKERDLPNLTADVLEELIARELMSPSARELVEEFERGSNPYGLTSTDLLFPSVRNAIGQLEQMRFQEQQAAEDARRIAERENRAPKRGFVRGLFRRLFVPEGFGESDGFD